MSEYPLEMLLGAAKRQRAQNFEDGFRDLASRCSSPIERLLLLALYDFNHYSTYPLDFTMAAYSDSAATHPSASATIFIQAPIGRYVADFLIVQHMMNDRIFVIECDGHDYHERTKKQAAHDRGRDRWMTINGYTVLRFTGSELHADPYRCADQVHDAMCVGVV